jgi:outer membrane protein OmpA-like peptidoglycan-associated protein
VTTEEKPSPSRVWYRRKKTGIIAATLGLLAVLILVSLPYGIQFGLADFLKQHGAQQVDIENIDFNPFTGRLLFQQVRAVAGDAQPLRLNRLELVLGWRELFSKRARVEAIEMQGLQASVDLSEPTELRVNGLVFPLVDSTKPSEPATPSTPWGFALDRVSLSQCVLAIRQRDLSFDVELDRLDLERVISWRQEVLAQLNLDARVNTAPVKAELEARLFEATRTVEGKIAIEGLALSGLQPLLTQAGGPDLSGRLSLTQTLTLTLAPAAEMQWQTDGNLSGEALNLKQAQIAGSDLSTRWQGTTAGEWSPEKGLRLRLDGGLTGGVPQLRLPGQGLGLSLDGYHWQGQLELAQGESGLTLQLTGEASLDQTSVTQTGSQPQQVRLAKLRLAPLSLQLQQSAEGALTLSEQGQIRLDSLALQQHQLSVDLASLQWQGSVSLAPGEDAPVLSGEGQGALDGLHLSAAEPKARLAQLQRIELDGLKLSPGNRIGLKGVRLQGIQLDEGQSNQGDPLLKSQSLSLTDIAFASSSGLSIAKVEPQGMVAALSRDKDGQMNIERLVERLQQAASPAASAGTASAKTESGTAEPMPIKIDRIALQGETKAIFTDHSVEPPFQMTLNVKQFHLSAIDSSRPKQPSPFRFVGSTGRHAEITAEGEITLFQSDPDGKLKGQLKGVELVPLTSYTIPAIGYNLDSGELDADIDLALKQGNVEGNNHLVIRRLDVSEASEVQAAKLKQQISMPLDSALGMLQDKNQTIDLNLPISGKLADPNVELGDVINTALGSALKKGAMTYLTTALFPYGTMVALLKMAGDEATAVRLNPVEFPPAQAQLDDQDRDYLGKVAKVLKDRPKIAVKLCGTATVSDRLAMAEAMVQEAKAKTDQKAQEKEAPAAKPNLQDVPEAEMLALAKRRAEAVEDYLVNQHGVSASRTAVCRPTLDPEAEAPPRVDLQI